MSRVCIVVDSPGSIILNQNTLKLVESMYKGALIISIVKGYHCDLGNPSIVVNCLDIKVQASIKSLPKPNALVEVVSHARRWGKHLNPDCPVS